MQFWSSFVVGSVNFGQRETKPSVSESLRCLFSASNGIFVYILLGEQDLLLCVYMFLWKLFACAFVVLAVWRLLKWFCEF